jgi:riboflavin kinase/FMN adenylyltransferase
MKLVRWSLSMAQRPADAVLAIGGFDGLHLGHQALIARVRTLAQERGLRSGVLSFEPLPREFLTPDAPPARVTNLRERVRVLSALGLDQFHVLRFTRRLMELSAEEFIALLRRGGARQIVVGHDFRFGHDGAGTVALLQQLGPAGGNGVEVISPVLHGGVRVGSSQVRQALAVADFARVTTLLGRPYAMHGRVHRGAQLGRTLGFPTANLPVQRRKCALSGIFAVRVSTVAAKGARLTGAAGVASLGTRPQVGGVEPLLEVHVFDFAGDLYGAELKVEFVSRLRDEAKFESLAAMTEQMQRDAAKARRVLAVRQHQG